MQDRGQKQSPSTCIIASWALHPAGAARNCSALRLPAGHACELCCVNRGGIAPNHILITIDPLLIPVRYYKSVQYVTNRLRVCWLDYAPPSRSSTAFSAASSVITKRNWHDGRNNDQGTNGSIVHASEARIIGLSQTMSGASGVRVQHPRNCVPSATVWSAAQAF